MKTGQSLNVVATGTGKSIFWNKNMNERINELRLDAGISQLKDDLRLAVIDREGNMIDPLIGLEKFAELIVRECAEQIRLQGTDWIDWQPSQQGIHPEYVAMAEHIKQHFGVKE
jgi:hypothetical protein